MLTALQCNVVSRCRGFATTELDARLVTGSLAHIVGEAWTGPKTVPKWSRERRAGAGLKESSRRDKSMRSMLPFPPENDSVQFCLMVWLLLLSTIDSGSIMSGISFLTLAPKLEVSVGMLNASQK